MVNGFAGAALAFQGKGVLRLAADFAPGDFPGHAHLIDVFGRFAHGFQGEQRLHFGVGVAPAQGGVVAGDVAGRPPGAGIFGEGVRRAAHAFHASGNKNVPFTGGNSAGSLVNGTETAGTEAVKGDARYVVGQSGQQGGHARHVAVILAGLVGAAKIHFLDLIGINTGILDGCLNNQCAQVVGADLSQGASVAANGSAQGVDDHDFVHGGNLLN